MNSKDIDINCSLIQFRNSYVEVLKCLKKIDSTLFESLKAMFDLNTPVPELCDNFCSRINNVAPLLDFEKLDADLVFFYKSLVNFFGSQKATSIFHFFDWIVQPYLLLGALKENDRQKGANHFPEEDASKLFCKLIESKKYYCDLSQEIKKSDKNFYSDWYDIQNLDIEIVTVDNNFLANIEVNFARLNNTRLLESSRMLNISSQAYLKNIDVKIMIDFLYFIRGLALITDDFKPSE